MKVINFSPGSLSLSQCELLTAGTHTLALTPHWEGPVLAAQETVNTIIKDQRTVYGINTGFGLLANTRIAPEQLAELQRRILISHATGCGPLLPTPIVRLILALKINNLARGYSGVRVSVIQALIALYNADILPCIPSKGSVGASGDLAPLAHLSAVLLGIGEVEHQGHRLSAIEGLAKAGLQPFSLAPKEGLALINGTQVSTAIALYALQKTNRVFASAIVSGMLSLDAAKGSDIPFDARIQTLSGHAEAAEVATYFRHLLGGSEIRDSHELCEKVQDPYSLRCQPKVMGACLMQMRFAEQVLLREANSVSDNPLVFSDTGDILSGGNFHAEPVAMAADNLALAIAEIGALSERRIALLVDPHFSGLPAFLVAEGGLNSGFMMAHVTAAALASENKSLAHPASVDSLPTSANQEDHVSMATFAARRLLEMLENTSTIVGIEWLAACQGLDFHAPLKTSPQLQQAHAQVRTRVPTYHEDRYFAPDITIAKEIAASDFSLQLLKR